MKIKLTIFVVILVLFVLTGCCFPSGSSTTAETTITETTAKPATEKGEYNIGDTGPAGGLIFYDNPNYITDGWRYLEAAPSDQSTEMQWCDGSDVTTGATATVVGTGKANTQKIVNIQGAGSYAAKLCNDLTQGGYSDWFLPSKDELNEMFKNLHLKGLGGFTDDYYWSSSEYNANRAWNQLFGFRGFQLSTSKYNYYARVRAVRTFTTPVTAITETAAKPATEKGEYNIGGTGPAGGLIFYLNPNYITDGWSYLEAATDDQSAEIQWCDGSNMATGALSTAVGTGKANTQKIVDIQGAGSYAAKICNDLTQGGYSDWFLPSKDELNEMFENLCLKSLGGFTNDYYWSSSGGNGISAWEQDFYDGYQGHGLKDSSWRVRAARAF